MKTPNNALQGTVHKVARPLKAGVFARLFHASSASFTSSIIGPLDRQMLQNTNHDFVSFVCARLAHFSPQNGHGTGEQLVGEVRRTTGRFDFVLLLGIALSSLFRYIALPCAAPQLWVRRCCRA